MKYQPRHFYVTRVVDDREDTGKIGTMNAGMMNKEVPVNLEHGTAGAIGEYLQRNMVQDRNRSAIELHITRLEASEKNETLKETANLTLGVAFYLNGKMLISFDGSGYMQTSRDASRYIEQLIRQNLERSIEQFDDWWGQNMDAATGKPGMKVEVVMATSSKDPDEIIYSKKPLSWDDFRGRADEMSRANAATSSGFGFRLSSQSVNNKMVATFTISPVFYKSKSWYKPEGKNTAALRHEQQHFNISALTACALAEEVRHTTFTVDAISTQMEDLLKKYNKQEEALQAQYDEETGHGMKKDKQAAWEEKIAAMLAASVCY